MKKYKWMGALGAWVLAAALLVSGCSVSRSPEAMVQTASERLQGAKAVEGSRVTVNTQEHHRYTYDFQLQSQPYVLSEKIYYQDERAPFITSFYDKQKGQLVNYYKSIINDPEKGRRSGCKSG